MGTTTARLDRDEDVELSPIAAWAYVNNDGWCPCCSDPKPDEDEELNDTPKVILKDFPKQG